MTTHSTVGSTAFTEPCLVVKMRQGEVMLDLPPALACTQLG